MINIHIDISKDVCSDNGGYQSQRLSAYSDTDDKSAYPLVHSTSIPNDAHKSRNWSSIYSRSSSISTESYYPSSSDETVTKDFDDEYDDDDPWSESYGRKYKIPGSEGIDQMVELSKADRERTPVVSKQGSNMATFSMDDLIQASNDLKEQDRKKANIAYSQRLDVYPASVIQEKSIPAVAMSRSPNQDTTHRPASRSGTLDGQRPSSRSSNMDAQRPSSRASMLQEHMLPDITMLPDPGRGAIRKRYRAPEPPSQGEHVYESLSDSPYHRSTSRTSNVDHMERPDSPKFSEPIQAKEFGRRSEISSTSVLNYPLSSRKYTDRPDTQSDKIRQLRTYKPVDGSEEELESKTTSIKTTTPAFNYPIMKSRSGSSSHSKLTKEQKRNMIEEKRMLETSRSNPLPPTHPNPPSNTGTCPHCKIHSWLPHSAGCPNAQNNVKKSYSSTALHRK